MASNAPLPGIPPDALVEHAGFVRSIARSILGRDDDADEAAQAAMTKALETGPRAPEARRSWLGTVVRNTALSMVRARSRREAAMRRAADAVPAVTKSTLDGAVRAETIRLVGEAVSALEEPERTAVLLRHYDGLPPREIAARLAVPVATVKSRLHRAHARLRERLEEGGTAAATRRRRALAAFAGLAPALLETGAAAGGGVVALGLGAKALLVAAAAVAAIGVGVALAVRRDEAPPKGERVAAVPADVAPAPAAGGLAKSAAPKPPTVTALATIFGVVRREGAPTAARIEISAPRPRRADPYGPESLRQWMNGPEPTGAPIATGASGADGLFSIAMPGSGWGIDVRATTPDGAVGTTSLEVPAEGVRVEAAIDVTPRTSTLSGRAVYADGRPFAGRVYASPDRSAQWALRAPVVDTDVQGRFSLSGLPAGPLAVIAFRPGELVAVRGVVDVSAEDLTLVVDEGLRPLTGRVVDADGKAVPGAVVVAMNLSGRTGATTDAEGRFAVAWDPSSLSLFVAAEGYGKLSLYNRDVSDPFEIRLERTAVVSGRVLRESDGMPVPGARVAVLSLQDGTKGVLLVEAAASDDGTFEAAGIAPGRVAVIGAAPGLRSPVPRRAEGFDWTPVAATTLPGARLVRDVRLVPASGFTGRVVDADGTPAPGATVRIPKSNDAFASPFEDWSQPRAWASDEKGEFRIDGLPDGVSCTLTASLPGRAPVAAVGVTPREGGTGPLELRFPPVRSLAVLVVDAATQVPIAAARVAVTTMQDPSHLLVSLTTDEHGRAVLRGVPEGALSLSVWKGRARETRSVEGGESDVSVLLSTAESIPAVPPPAAGPRDRNGVTAPKPSPLEDPSVGKALFVARVLDPQGRPVPKGSAYLRNPNGAAGVYVAGGRVTVDRSPEDPAVFEVWRAADAYDRPLPFAAKRVPLRPGQTEIEVRLEPERQVAGTVLGADGHPVAGVQVFAAWPDRDSTERFRPTSWDSLGDGRSEADGTFRVGGLADEEVLLFAVPPAGAAPVPVMRVRAGTRDAVIRLRPAVSFQVRVVDPAGAPVPAADVRLSPSKDASRFLEIPARKTDAAGVCRLEDLDPTSTYRVIVQAMERPELRMLLVKEWTPKDDTFRIPRPTTLRGVVVDLAGRSVPGALVQPSRPDGPGWGVWTHAAADGSFEIADVLEGELTLRASVKDSIARSDTKVAVASDARDPVRLTLDVGETRTVRIAGIPPSATKVYGSLYEGTPSRDAPRLGFTVQGGEEVLSFAGVRPGRTYTLWIHSRKDWYVLARDFTWGADEPTFATATGRTVVGTVVGYPRGEGFEYAQARGGGVPLPGTLDEEGRFSIRGLPPGEWVVEVRISRPGHEYAGEAPVPADGRVDVTVAPEPR